MGKILTKYLLSVMVLASILFIACKDDDSSSDDKNNTIVGVWVSDKLPYYDDNKEVIGEAVAYMWYQQNGNFIEADCLRSFETGHEWIELSENGKWTVEKDIVTQTTNFGDDETFDTDVFKFNIKGNSLFMTYNVDGKDVTAELKRSTVEVIQNIINEKKKPKEQD